MSSSNPEAVVNGRLSMITANSARKLAAAGSLQKVITDTDNAISKCKDPDQKARYRSGLTVLNNAKNATSTVETAEEIAAAS